MRPPIHRHIPPASHILPLGSATRRLPCQLYLISRTTFFTLTTTTKRHDHTSDVTLHSSSPLTLTSHPHPHPLVRTQRSQSTSKQTSRTITTPYTVRRVVQSCLMLIVKCAGQSPSTIPIIWALRLHNVHAYVIYLLPRAVPSSVLPPWRGSDLAVPHMELYRACSVAMRKGSIPRHP